ncbi:MAG: class I SAM-dependent methyltransferase [Bacteriovoracaceae bacterium]|jgi:SAM-dependent methyltransferase|nr:class I SAM-dependent methyltransferase [Bacteriovoracaceae bacterium]
MLNCRLCGSTDLYKFLDLGFTPPADQFRRKDQLKEPVIHYPLEVCVCDVCSFVQLNHIVTPEILYRNDYPYESSTTRQGYEHWDGFAEDVVSRFDLDKDSLVVDIGSNVGTLLSRFKSRGTKVLGVDPAANIVRMANENGIETICDFFNSESVDTITEKSGKASVITGTNVFAHIDDLSSFINNAKKLMTKKGVLIIEAPYFVNLVNKLEYDTIYHEHLSYISIKPLVPFLEKFNMEIFDVRQVDIHGGSCRIYMAEKNSRKVEPIVGELIENEISMKLYDHKTLDEFSEKVKQNRFELTTLLSKLKSEGKTIVGVSAPAKGMTLLNYCKIGKQLLDVVTEKSKLKIGRYTPGDHIPVVTDEYLLEHQPDYALLLAWNFADEIIKNNSEYQKRGGKFIIPIPMPHIV